MIGCFIEIIGALLGAFANGTGSACLLTSEIPSTTSFADILVYQVYMAGRFVLGFGSSFNSGMAGLLITETAHPQHRAKISAIVNCMYGVGSTTCAWLALATMQITGTWSWRSLTILQAFPGILVLSLIYWIPESPRWLVAQKRFDDAETMLARYHGNGDKENETVVFEFEEMQQTLAAELKDKKKATGSFLDFVRTAGNRYRVMLLVSLAMVSQYSGTNLTSNYANKIYEGAGITNQTQKILVRFGPVMSMSLKHS
jgi:MFS family permease